MIGFLFPFVFRLCGFLTTDQEEQEEKYKQFLAVSFQFGRTQKNQLRISNYELQMQKDTAANLDLESEIALIHLDS